MSRKNRAHFHEPVSQVPAAGDISSEIPIEDTLEVGAIMLIEEPMPDGSIGVETVFLINDGSAETQPPGIGDVMEPSDVIEFSVVAEYVELEQAKPDTFGGYNPPIPEGGHDITTETVKNKSDDFKDKAADVADAVQDKAQDMAQNISSTAQDIAGKAQNAAADLKGKAQDAVSGIADKAQDTVSGIQDTVSAVADKAQDAAQTAADKAKDAAQTIAAKAESAKNAAADAGKKSKSVVAGAAGTVGMGLWSIIQRSPLQAIVFLSSLVWLLRSNSATASQTPVSVGEAAEGAAEKVGTLSGHVQVAASNLGGQVKTSAQQGAGWFSTTLQENPLVIGAMALVAGLGLGLAVPETAYEHKTLGKTRDQLLDKATEAASDLGHKVTAVASTAVHEAVETAKTEAKNQGLAPQDEAPQTPPTPEQPQQSQAQQQ